LAHLGQYFAALPERTIDVLGIDFDAKLPPDLIPAGAKQLSKEAH
jgi:hypothetical protein